MPRGRCSVKAGGFFMCETLNRLIKQEGISEALLASFDKKKLTIRDALKLKQAAKKGKICSGK